MSTVNFLTEWNQFRKDAELCLGTLLHGVTATHLLGAPPGKPSISEQKRAALEALSLDWQNCMRCSLHRSRKHVVCGEGEADARLVVLMDSPDADEDRTAKPAQMEQGELLEKMLRAVGFAREEVFVTHTLKCLVPPERLPQEKEIDTCFKFLQAQMEIVQPNFILALGEVSAQTILRTDADLAHLRGKWGEFRDAAVLPTWSPGELLAKPEKKREAWNDLKLLIARREKYAI